MEKKIIIGPYSWDGTPGMLSVEVTDVASNDWKDITAEGSPAGKPKTIKELKHQLGEMQGYLIDPIGNKKFLFDLTPWSNLDEETLLRMVWSFTPDHPIPSHVVPPWRKHHP